jgi:hypothetical protein
MDPTLPPPPFTTNKDKLKEKLKNKKKQRAGKATNTVPSSDPDILSMMEQVSSILRTNPDLVKQVSKCVSNVMNDKTLMNSISGKLQTDQTFDNNDTDEEPDAESKELRQ